MTDPWRAALSTAEQRQGVWYFTEPGLWAEREGRYLKVRELEGRRYPDDVVRRLPTINAAHPLAHEWRRRTRSAQRLRNHLAAAGRPLTVLELGCGNGWLTHFLAALPDCSVLGLDVNQAELEQAARVFSGDERATFAFGDLFGLRLASQLDVIVLASVIQYFADVPALFRRLYELIPASGQVHVLDSPVYGRAEVEGARARTEAYYAGLGVPECAADYHHVVWDSLRPFRPVLHYDPRAIWNWWRVRLGWDSPFPWLMFSPSS